MVASYYRTPIPTTTSNKVRTKRISYKKGVNNYSDNDDIDVSQLYAAIDARMVKIGRYKTRKGLDRYSVPVGETVDAQITSTTGASTAAVNGTSMQAQRLTVVSAGHITKATVKVGATTATGVFLVELRQDNSGYPGAVLDSSTIRRSDITSTQTSIPVYFAKTPEVTAGQVIWLCAYAQESATGNFLVSTNTSATTSITASADLSQYTANSYVINCAVYVTPHNPVLGFIRANRPNGSNYTFFVAGTSLYSVNESTGATTVISSSLDVGATKYRMEFVQDTLFMVNGLGKPYKYDFTTLSQLTSCPINPHIIIEHVGLLFVGREDDTIMYWSGFGVYDSWTSTDFAYMLAPKTAFPLRAFAKLNGVLYPFAEKNKYQFLGEDNQSFSASEAISQRGTFSQESLTYDDDAIYHADNEGIWMFDGTSQKNLAEPFLEDYRNLLNKNKIVLERWNNRLYVFHSRSGGGVNDSCYVINLALGGIYESLDTNTYIGRAYARKDVTDLFLQASNTVAAVYKAEDSGNDYHNLGGPLSYQLATAFSGFDSTAQYKRCTKWRPEVSAATGNYSLQCGYAYDMSEVLRETINLPVGASTTRWDSGWTWGNGTRYATSSNVTGDGFRMNGTFKRVQRVYSHTAAREPIEFDSEVLEIEIQRMR